MKTLKNWINKIYLNRYINHIFHTSIYCLKHELEDCNSVLDLGCGPDSPIKYCNVRYKIGVDAYTAYITESTAKKIHQEYVISDISNIEFKSKSFDAVIMIEVLEHLPKEKAKVLLSKAEKWARKKVVLSCPNGYLPQTEMGGNPFQKHLSGWNIKELKNLGYKVYGMAGLKIMRKENPTTKIKDEESFFATIRFHPRMFWFAVSAISQIIVYYYSPYAFGIFCVKKIKKLCN